MLEQHAHDLVPMGWNRLLGRWGICWLWKRGSESCGDGCNCGTAAVAAGERYLARWVAHYVGWSPRLKYEWWGSNVECLRLIPVAAPLHVIVQSSCVGVGDRDAFAPRFARAGASHLTPIAPDLSFATLFGTEE
jgi:hypothetical protein